MALKERRASLKDERGPFCCGKELLTLTRVGLTRAWDEIYGQRLDNGGDVLIANARGQRIGNDPATGQMVNEIPDAHIVYLRGVHAKYWIPLGEASEVYEVTVSGANISAQVDTDLVMVGPGYIVGFEDIQLQPSHSLRMSMSADGRQLVFDEGQAAPSPQMFQAID
jgi:hypothetical protein